MSDLHFHFESHYWMEKKLKMLSVSVYGHVLGAECNIHIIVSNKGEKTGCEISSPEYVLEVITILLALRMSVSETLAVL